MGTEPSLNRYFVGAAAAIALVVVLGVHLQNSVFQRPPEETGLRRYTGARHQGPLQAHFDGVIQARDDHLFDRGHLPEVLPEDAVDISALRVPWSEGVTHACFTSPRGLEAVRPLLAKQGYRSTSSRLGAPDAKLAEWWPDSMQRTDLEVQELPGRYFTWRVGLDARSRVVCLERIERVD